MQIAAVHSHAILRKNIAFIMPDFSADMVNLLTAVFTYFFHDITYEIVNPVDFSDCGISIFLDKSNPTINAMGATIKNMHLTPISIGKRTFVRCI
jgi:hypothetical protein